MFAFHSACGIAEIITLRAIALKRPVNTIRPRPISAAEIITLRAIALKPRRQRGRPNTYAAEIITLRAIALKLHASWLARCCRDHNATSYSTETRRVGALIVSASGAEIITLRAIALKLYKGVSDGVRVKKAEIITLRAIALKLEGIRDNTKSREVSRDHNATSYSTETRGASGYLMCFFSRDHNATSYSTETLNSSAR